MDGKNRRNKVAVAGRFSGQAAYGMCVSGYILFRRNLLE